MKTTVVIVCVMLTILALISTDIVYVIAQTTTTLSQTYTLSERLTSYTKNIINYTLSEQFTNPVTTLPQSYTLSEHLTSYTKNVVTYLLDEKLLTRTYALTTTMTHELTITEYLKEPRLLPLPTYTYPYTNPYAPKQISNCLSVEPTQVSETLFKYTTNGKFHIYGSFKNLSSLSLVIYPNSDIYGQYQQICNNLYYCGFRSSLWLLFSNDTKTLFVSVSTINYPTVTNRTSVDVYYFNIELKEEIRDFSGIGSLIVWLVHVVTFNDKYNVVTDYELPLWSAFYQRENDKFPFPIEIYSTSSSLYVYDCGTTTQLWLCPSDNPLVCALWSFARIIYNLLPDPIKALINTISSLGNIIISLIAYITNPQVVSLIVTFIPFTFLLLFVILTLRGGIVGVMQFFIEVFELLKKIGEFIINVFRSIIP